MIRLFSIAMVAMTLAVGCKTEPSPEEVYTKEMLERLNTALLGIKQSNLSLMSEQASMRASFKPTFDKAKNFDSLSDKVIKYDYGKESFNFEEFTTDYHKAMDEVADLANSNKFKFFMKNVEPVTELLPKSDINSRGDRELLIAKMRNDVLVNTIAAIRYFNYEMSYENIFGEKGNKKLEMDTTGLKETGTFKLKLPGLRYRDTLAVTRDMITITENGKDITDQVEFEIYDYDPDVVGIVEMKTTEPGDYEFSGTFDIYFQRKEFVLHQPFDFKFTIK